MLADLLDWIKQTIYLLVFLTLMLQILPHGNYRKYVKFFAGLIFVVTLLGPVMSLFMDRDWESLILETLADSRMEYQMPDFDSITEAGNEIYEKYAAEMAEDLMDE